LIFNQAGENQVSAASLGLIQVGKSRHQVAGFATRAAEIGQRLRATFDKNSEIKDCRASLGFCRKEIKEIKLFKREKPRRPHCAASRPKKEISPNELMDGEKFSPLNCLPRGLRAMPMMQKTDARVATAALAATSEGGSWPIQPTFAFQARAFDKCRDSEFRNRRERLDSLRQDIKDIKRQKRRKARRNSRPQSTIPTSELLAGGARQEFSSNVLLPGRTRTTCKFFRNRLEEGEKAQRAEELGEAMSIPNRGVA